MKSIRALACAAALVISMFSGCRKETAVTETGTSATGQGSTQAAATDSVSTTAVATTTAGTDVTLEFFGTIAHLMPPGQYNRSVFMRKKHDATMTVLKGITEAELKKVWAANEVSCSSGKCTVPLTGMSVQFASKGTVIPQPTSITSDKTFEEAVPHLAKITGSSMGPTHKKFSKVRSDAETPDPPAPGNNLISAWVELPEGKFFAEPNIWTARFEPDHEGTNERLFGEYITLTSTIDTPTLVVRKGASKFVIPVDAGGLRLDFRNEPITKVEDMKNKKHHFHLFYALSSMPLSTGDQRPRIRPIRMKFAPAIKPSVLQLIYDVLDADVDADMEEMEGTARVKSKKHIDATEREIALARMVIVEVPGCSNSQWP